MGPPKNERKHVLDIMIHQTTGKVSRRLEVVDILRVIGIWLVMFVHSPVEYSEYSNPWVYVLKNFLARGAVTMFLILSGYLNAGRICGMKFRWKDYAKEKWRALILPYLFWNVLVLTLVLVMNRWGVGMEFRGGGAYFQVEETVNSAFSAIFGIGRDPIVYQFWSFRDLIVAVFVGAAMERWLPRVPLLPFLLILVPLPVIPSIGFYLLGHRLAEKMPRETLMNIRGGGIYVVLWLAMGVAAFYGWVSVVTPILRLCGASCLFMMALVLVRWRWGKVLAQWGPLTFFLYAVHEPTQGLLGKVWQKVDLPGYGTEWSFVMVPVVTFCGALVAYRVLEWACPWLLRVATGNRVRAGGSDGGGAGSSGGGALGLRRAEN